MKHTIKHNILLLVLSFAPRGFSPGTPVFPSPQKPAFPNSNLTGSQVDEEPVCGVLPPNHYLFIYLSFQPMKAPFLVLNRTTTPNTLAS